MIQASVCKDGRCFAAKSVIHETVSTDVVSQFAVNHERVFENLPPGEAFADDPEITLRCMGSPSQLLKSPTRRMVPASAASSLKTNSRSPGLVTDCRSVGSPVRIRTAIAAAEARPRVKRRWILCL